MAANADPTARFAAFAALHRPGRPLLLPNAWDHASAAAFARAGFAAVGTTSLGVAAAVGAPDAAGATRAETLSLARAIAPLALVTVDVEGGFGATPATAGQLAGELLAAGVAGLNVEDGRPGERLAPVDEQSALIAALKRAAPTLFVNARTDGPWLYGDQADLRDAAARLQAYAAAGADGVFVPGRLDDAAIVRLVDATSLPLNVLAAPGRTLAELAALGVARVSFGSLLYRVGVGAALATALAVRDGGPVDDAGAPSYAELASVPPARAQLELRPLAAGDEHELRRIRALPEVARWWDEPEPGFPWDDDPEATRLAIVVDGAVAGLIQFSEELEPKYRHAGIDVFLDPALHGRGLGSEAVRRVARHLIDERGHHRLTIDPAAANVAAIRAYEKAGFRPVGVMRRYERDADGAGWHDGLLMELLADEC